MRFEELFLEKADLQKFDMFRRLVRAHNDTLTITDLSLQMNLSYQQSYNIFQELLQDVAALTGLSRATAKRALTQGTLTLSVDRYRYTLLEDTIAFQFLDYVVQASQPRVDQFSADHYISHSTLLRKTTPLRRFLTRYRLKLSLTQAKLTGDEKQIRLFLQQVYWLAYRGLRWPFKAIDQPALVAQYQALPTAATDPILAMQEQVFWAVCRTRIAHNDILKWTDRFKQLFTGYPTPSLIYQTSQFPRLTQREVQAESDFFDFYQQKNVRFTPLTPREDALMTYLKARPHTGWSVVSRLINALNAEDATTVAPLWADPQLVMNMLRLATSFYLMDGNYLKQADFFTTAQLVYQQTQLRDYLTAVINGLPDTPEFAPYKREAAVFSQMLSLLFVPVLNRFAQDTTVAVKLVMASSDIVHGDIREFLANIAVVTVLPADAPLTAADLLITAEDDFITPHQVFTPPAVATFDWYLDATETDYYLLYQRIYQLYQAKLQATGTALNAAKSG
ncbi:helix-turn-helix domain-containing protein [Lacticaseibacillus daqingensis]|uniref:helix-turn-helix domain-containing protein n=1 Tax=Lacticaseibacillus daqingensis TaxID=2486014 RepID=UPI000F766F44|nr:helix-turn-helix domain-containing protein [Lacticaseibacillus daqingensis]